MTSQPRAATIRIGYLPLTDAAPLVVAQTHGMFERRGIRVELVREVGWATIRDKIRLGELDAAQAPAPMLWSMRLGLGCPPCPVLTALILNLNGNAVTVSNRLGTDAREAEGLRQIVRRRGPEQPLTIGSVFPFSSDGILIREWLRRCGLDGVRDVRTVIVPPEQMYRNLVAGTLDGYAASEPWNSLAVRDGVGWCPLWSAALLSPQIEKVLMVTESFAAKHSQSHLQIVAAIAEAARWCDAPQNRDPLARLLAKPDYLDLSHDLIAPTLLGRFDAGLGTVENVADFHVFSRDGAGSPSAAKAAAFQGKLRATGIVTHGCDAGLPGKVFREDIYREAIATNENLPPGVNES